MAKVTWEWRGSRVHRPEARGSGEVGTVEAGFASTVAAKGRGSGWLERVVVSVMAATMRVRPAGEKAGLFLGVTRPG
jgi:hypothetical protein